MKSFHAHAPAAVVFGETSRGPIWNLARYGGPKHAHADREDADVDAERHAVEAPATRRQSEPYSLPTEDGSKSAPSIRQGRQRQQPAATGGRSSPTPTPPEPVQDSTQLPTNHSGRRLAQRPKAHIRDRLATLRRTKKAQREHKRDYEGRSLAKYLGYYQVCKLIQSPSPYRCGPGTVGEEPAFGLSAIALRGLL
jgi:hypothetical protein